LKLSREQRLHQEVQAFESVRAQQRALDWQEVAGLSSGAGLRLLVHVLYEVCGLHASIEEQSSLVYRLEGRRDVAVQLLKEIPKEYALRIFHAYPNLLSEHPAWMAEVRAGSEPKTESEGEDGRTDDGAQG